MKSAAPTEQIVARTTTVACAARTQPLGVGTALVDMTRSVSMVVSSSSAHSANDEEHLRSHWGGGESGVPLNDQWGAPRICVGPARQFAGGSWVAKLGVHLYASPIRTRYMTKRLIDVDDDALDAARAQLGTRTIKDTVNEALRNAGRQRSTQLASALSALAEADLDDRSAAWR